MNREFPKIVLLVSILLSIFQGTKTYAQSIENFRGHSGMLQILIDNSGSMACESDEKCTPENLEDIRNPRNTKIEQAKNAAISWAFQEPFSKQEIKPRRVQVIELTGQVSQDEINELCITQPSPIWDLKDSSTGISTIEPLIRNIIPNPYGTTPITFGLMKAVESYISEGKEGSLKIILISDAGSNCDRTEQRDRGFSEKSLLLQQELLKIPTPCEYIDQQIKAGILDEESVFLEFIAEKNAAQEIDNISEECFSVLRNNFSVSLVDSFDELDEQLEISSGGDWIKQGITINCFAFICTFPGGSFKLSEGAGQSLAWGAVLVAATILIMNQGKTISDKLIFFLGSMVASIMISLGNGLASAGDSLKEAGEELKKSL